MIYFYLYFHQHVSASNPAVFRVMLLMQEYNLVKCVTFTPQY